VKPGPVSLEDKYLRAAGRVFMTGHQAVARALMLQRERDAAAGLDTAGFISGYRGSPLGGLDQTLWKARAHLEAHRITFQPGVNEDLAATAVWGTQQLGLARGSRHDGVFALWYGKGPGVDRCGDVFRHANAAGTAPHGGVLALAGDDHAARSSTLPHQTDHVFQAVMMPILAPAGVQEILDLALHGWAMSRFAGCWVAFKVLADIIECSASVEIDPRRVKIALPQDFAMPPGGLNIRWPDPPMVQEERLLDHKLEAAAAYCRSNGLNRIVLDSPNARLGILTAGKAFLDVRQALEDLGIDAPAAARVGIRLFKAGMVWPLEPEGVRAFAEGLEEILVVEEKRPILETQIKEQFYDRPEPLRPRVIGKLDERGNRLLPATGELDPALVARAIASRVGRFHDSDRMRSRLAFLDAKAKALARAPATLQRVPYFCPGCPHNTSTRVPEGSRALAGIGCHYMALWMDRSTATFSHMGGEGAAWIGQSPFTDEKHVFANLGDGTWFHSGSLAIRAAVAAGVSITYKILFNDAVAMTGGQPVEGALCVPAVVRQLAAEGVKRIVVVTDQPEKYAGPGALPERVQARDRSELDRVQRELREFHGVSALIYDQTCAAEKRRRRHRGTYPDPARRMFINEAVCEGCGDCGVQSNCLAIVPLETEFGRKRAIDQSACNKDFSCLAGFCPSFVTVEGGRPRRGAAMAGDDGRFDELPSPELPPTVEPCNLLVTGVGGTGVVTIGALIGMAAHVDGKGVSVLDMAGLAQKGGAVYSHVRICDDPAALHAVRIAAGEADAVIGGDLVVSASGEALAKMCRGRSRAVVNCAETPTAEFTRDPDWRFPMAAMREAIAGTIGEEAAAFVDASRLATRLMGDAIATNAFLLGYAWQKGWVPVSLDALEQAIELNGVAVEMNHQALLWGRRAAHDPAAVERFASGGRVAARPAGLEAIVAQRVEILTAYQDRTLARRYRALVERVRSAESALGSIRLAEAVAHGYFKLLAYKDEYEVARLYADPRFLDGIRESFEGDVRLHFHLAPPFLSRPDPATGVPAKRAFGPWMMTAFRMLAALRFLRASRLDPFASNPDRRAERELIRDYEQDIGRVAAELDAARLSTAIEIARLPERIRGFGHVKRAAIGSARARREELWREWRSAPAGAAAP